MAARPKRRREREQRRRSKERANARIHSPQHLVGATDWANDPDILSADWIIRTTRQQVALCQPVIDTAYACMTKHWGPARKPGDWVTAFLCFMTSRYPDIQPWLKLGTTAAFWRELGFEDKPPYNTVRDNFIALQKSGAADVFRTGGDRLVQHARRHDERIGRHVSVDGCETETHGGLIHDCKRGEGCPYETGEEVRPSRRTGRGGRGRHHQQPRGAGTRPLRDTSARAKQDRQNENEMPPEQAQAHRRAQDVERVQMTADGRLRVKVGNHWYIQTDPDAGRRTYKGPRGARRFWVGYYTHDAEDDFTGGALALNVNNASRQEWAIYPELLQDTIEAIGDVPEAVMGDKGFSVETVFELNSKLGIASVFPWRPKNGSDYGPDTPWFDRHGIPRCAHCGAEGQFVRFAAEPYPRLWFVCSLLGSPDCLDARGKPKEQTISCSRDWCTLLPLWRNDPLYHQLKEAHDTHERGHDLRRDRFRVGGDNRDIRPKRMGIEWQRLRAQAARFLEWLAICDWNGWLGSGRDAERGRNRQLTELVESGTPGKRAHAGLMRMRALTGLSNPYGERAMVVYRKSRWLTLPSERGRNGPKPPEPEPPPDEQ